MRQSLILLLLWLTPLVAHAAPTQAGLVFSPAGWPQTLAGDFYRPAGSARAVPVVLLIHGGGWRSGKRHHMETFAESLVAAGYAAFTIDYRFAPEHPYPAQLEDVRLAVHWLKSQAGTLGIDPARMAAWGYSAGAHLASLLVLGERDPALRAVVAGGLPGDLVDLKNSPLVKSLMGGPIDVIGEARYREASPRFLVDADDAPVFLFHARWDWVVPTRQADTMKAALDAAGVSNERVWLEGRGHIAGFYFNEAAVDAALRFLDRWMKPAR